LKVLQEAQLRIPGLVWLLLAFYLGIGTLFFPAGVVLLPQAARSRQESLMHGLATSLPFVSRCVTAFSLPDKQSANSALLGRNACFHLL